QTTQLTNTSGQMASAENAHHQATPSDAAARSRARRENTYRASYHRKHGTNPTDQQVRAWYAHTYRQQPSGQKIDGGPSAPSGWPSLLTGRSAVVDEFVRPPADDRAGGGNRRP